MKTIEAHQLQETFAVLKPDLSADTVAVSPTLYEGLRADYDGFKGHTLVSEHEFSEPWGMWERHPAGDEIIVLLSGAVSVRIRMEHDEELVELSRPGAYVVIPCGQWHTAATQVPTKLLFITPGEGTEHQSAN